MIDGIIIRKSANDIFCYLFRERRVYSISTKAQNLKSGTWVTGHKLDSVKTYEPESVITPLYKSYVIDDGIEFILKYTVGTTSIEPFGTIDISNVSFEHKHGQKVIAVLRCDFAADPSKVYVNEILFACDDSESDLSLNALPPDSFNDVSMGVISEARKFNSIEKDGINSLQEEGNKSSNVLNDSDAESDSFDDKAFYRSNSNAPSQKDPEPDDSESLKSESEDEYAPKVAKISAQSLYESDSEYEDASEEISGNKSLTSAAVAESKIKTEKSSSNNDSISSSCPDKKEFIPDNVTQSQSEISPSSSSTTTTPISEFNNQVPLDYDFSFVYPAGCSSTTTDYPNKFVPKIYTDVLYTDEEDEGVTPSAKIISQTTSSSSSDLIPLQKETQDDESESLKSESEDEYAPKVVKTLPQSLYETDSDESSSDPPRCPSSNERVSKQSSNGPLMESNTLSGTSKAISALNKNFRLSNQTTISSNPSSAGTVYPSKLKKEGLSSDEDLSFSPGHKKHSKLQSKKLSINKTAASNASSSTTKPYNEQRSGYRPPPPDTVSSTAPRAPTRPTSQAVAASSDEDLAYPPKFQPSVQSSSTSAKKCSKIKDSSDDDNLALPPGYKWSKRDIPASNNCMTGPSIILKNAKFNQPLSAPPYYNQSAADYDTSDESNNSFSSSASSDFAPINMDNFGCQPPNEVSDASVDDANSFMSSSPPLSLQFDQEGLNLAGKSFNFSPDVGSESEPSNEDQQRSQQENSDQNQETAAPEEVEDLSDIVQSRWKHGGYCDMDFRNLIKTDSKYLIVEKFKNIAIIFDDSHKSFGLIYRPDNLLTFNDIEVGHLYVGERGEVSKAISQDGMPPLEYFIMNIEKFKFQTQVIDSEIHVFRRELPIVNFRILNADNDEFLILDVGKITSIAFPAHYQNYLGNMKDVKISGTVKLFIEPYCNIFWNYVGDVYITLRSNKRMHIKINPSQTLQYYLRSQPRRPTNEHFPLPPVNNISPLPENFDNVQSTESFPTNPFYTVTVPLQKNSKKQRGVNQQSSLSQPPTQEVFSISQIKDFLPQRTYEACITYDRDPRVLDIISKDLIKLQPLKK